MISPVTKSPGEYDMSMPAQGTGTRNNKVCLSVRKKIIRTF